MDRFCWCGDFEGKLKLGNGCYCYSSATAGVPFASPDALFNLSNLAVSWLRLGIETERIKPGRPQQNGGHERMDRP